MNILLVGIGSFGQGWYRRLKADLRGWHVSVVDSDPGRAGLLDASDRFYTSLEDAFRRDTFDVLVNLTPPAVHTAVDRAAFIRGIPVLSEKPIAEDFADAQEIVAESLRMGVPFMIAENYRRAPVMRQTRKLIAAGEIGPLSGIHVQFFKEAYYPKPYLVAMENPLLTDVVVHHLDLMRYLSGEEAVRILARNYRPLGSPYPGNAGLFTLLEMKSGLHISFDGSLSAKGKETTWNGNWRFEGPGGVLTIIDDQLRLTRGKKTRTLSLDGAPDTHDPLDEFLRALQEGREPETSGRDYLHTQALVHYAAESSRMGKMVEVEG
jgi:predicted dehydrogenase